MCDDGPDPVYQGKTYRRQRAPVNESTLSQFGGAWKGGRNNNGTVKDSVNASRRLMENTNSNPFSGLSGVPGGGGPKYVEAPEKSESLRPSFGMNPFRQRPKTFNVNAHLDPGVYEADDGSFLTSSKSQRNTNAGGGLGSLTLSNQAPPQYETHRYVEDPEGSYGVNDFNDKGVPTKFMNLGGYDVQSTSGQKELKMSNIQEPERQDTPKDRRKRQKGSVSTSSFRISLGTPAKKSGLRVPA